MVRPVKVLASMRASNMASTPWLFSGSFPKSCDVEGALCASIACCDVEVARCDSVTRWDDGYWFSAAVLVLPNVLLAQHT